jgi:hypothetical protein
MAQDIYFDNGANPSSLVFRSQSGNGDYSVVFDLRGYVFDENKVFEPSYGSVNTATVHDGDVCGYYKPGQSNSATGDVTEAWGAIGCARYDVAVTYNGGSTIHFTLDFTDANWVSSTDYSILFDLDHSGNDPVITCYVVDNSSTDGWLYSGIGSGWEVKYWVVVRQNPTSQSYVRDRTGFTLPSGSYPPTIGGGQPANLGVSVYADGDITVPYTRTFWVETDNDPYNDCSETTISMEDGSSFIVNGALETMQTRGIIRWTSASANPSPGQWDVFSVNGSASVSLTAAVIEYGEGLYLNGCTGNIAIDGCTVQQCAGRGIEAIDCDPEISWSWCIDNSGYGIKLTGNGTATIDDCAVYNTSQMSGNYGDGLYSAEDMNLTLANSSVYDNARHGVNLESGARDSYLLHNDIHGHTAGYGIHLNETDPSEWTTVRESRIYGNYAGIRAEQGSRLRGWHTAVQDSSGLNCIFENEINIWGNNDVLFELGTVTYTGATAHFPGGRNDIVYGGLEVLLQYGSTGYFRSNFWDGDQGNRQVDTDCIFEYEPDTTATYGNCQESAPAGVQVPERLAALLAPLTHQPGRDICSEAKEAALLRRSTGTTETANPCPDRNGYILSTACPNPFGRSAAIGFTLPRREWIRLSIHDAIGREVAVLGDAEYPAGRSAVRFDAPGLRSGVYFCRLQAGGVVLTKKLMHVK